LECRTAADGAGCSGFGNEGGCSGHRRHGKCWRIGGLCACQKAQHRVDRAILVLVGRRWAVGLSAVRAVNRDRCYFSGMAKGAAVKVSEGQRKLEGNRGQRHPTAKPAPPPKPAHGPKIHVPTAFPDICNIITIAAVKAGSRSGR
jgi:hypothetical protein